MSSAEKAGYDLLNRTMVSSDAWVLHPESAACRTVINALLAETQRLRAERDALLAVLDPLLVAVEPVRWALLKEIDSEVEAKQEWAKRHNATCGNSNEMWFYSTEFRRSLEKEIEPFTKAVWEANQAYDNIKGLTECSE